MKAAVKEFALFFCLQFASYLNVTLDIRAVAHEQYAVAAATNVVAPLIAWIMVKKITATKKNAIGMAAVVLGAVSSTWVGMWVTRHW